MDQLWAPWRLSYITNPTPKKDPNECFLCKALAEDRDRENYIVCRNPHSVVILNRYPYNNGHLLIAPLAHKATPADLNDAETLELQRTLTQMMAILEKQMQVEGFNVGLNLGRVAGAGLPGHLHWHLVPRWFGDMNFMPILTDAKVIVQSLDSLWELLTRSLQAQATE